MKSFLRHIIPRALIDLYRGWKLARLRKANQARSVKQVFTRVYEQHQWGGTDEYCSGSGSSELNASRYAAVVKLLIKEKGITTVVDLGCGDFVIGRALQMDGVKYIGVDVVDGLVSHLEREYGDANTVFMCLDIAADPLPDGDLCLIRQVLQHLSNDQISSVLLNTRKYRYVLITEHYPAPTVEYVPNLDKPHGPDTRVFDNSAVYLDNPPFNMNPLSMTLVSDTPLEKGERLKTFLVENRRIA